MRRDPGSNWRRYDEDDVRFIAEINRLVARGFTPPLAVHLLQRTGRDREPLERLHALLDAILLGPAPEPLDPRVAVASGAGAPDVVAPDVVAPDVVAPDVVAPDVVDVRETDGPTAGSSAHDGGVICSHS